MVMYLRIWRTSSELKKTSAAPPSARDGVNLHRASLGQRWSKAPPRLPRSEMEYICVTAAAANVETGRGMLCWEMAEKRRGDTTSPRNAAADFAVSRALEVVSRAHDVPTFCTAGACPWENGRFESIQGAWAGGALRTVPATTHPVIWHPIS
jgi:hypothetical protein